MTKSQTSYLREERNELAIYLLARPLKVSEERERERERGQESGDGSNEGAGVAT